MATPAAWLICWSTCRPAMPVVSVSSVFANIVSEGRKREKDKPPPPPPLSLFGSFGLLLSSFQRMTRWRRGCSCGLLQYSCVIRNSFSFSERLDSALTRWPSRFRRNAPRGHHQPSIASVSSRSPRIKLDRIHSAPNGSAEIQFSYSPGIGRAAPSCQHFREAKPQKHT
jgi:hypothetical protein